MTSPYAAPQVTFTGNWGDSATGSWYPAQAALSGGMVTLWIGTAQGWVAHFTVPATEVVVKSAAQRITLVVRGQSYPILADPGAIGRGNGLAAMNVVGGITDSARLSGASLGGRVANQVGAANAFAAAGGPQFLAAMQQSGGRTSRLGYGAIAGIGCGVALATVVVVLVLTTVALSL